MKIQAGNILFVHVGMRVYACVHMCVFQFIHVSVKKNKIMKCLAWEMASVDKVLATQL